MFLYKAERRRKSSPLWGSISTLILLLFIIKEFCKVSATHLRLPYVYILHPFVYKVNTFIHKYSCFIYSIFFSILFRFLLFVCESFFVLNQQKKIALLHHLLLYYYFFIKKPKGDETSPLPWGVHLHFLVLLFIWRIKASGKRRTIYLINTYYTTLYIMSTLLYTKYHIQCNICRGFFYLIIIALYEYKLFYKKRNFLPKQFPWLISPFPIVALVKSYLILSYVHYTSLQIKKKIGFYNILFNIFSFLSFTLSYILILYLLASEQQSYERYYTFFYLSGMHFPFYFLMYYMQIHKTFIKKKQNIFKYNDYLKKKQTKCKKFKIP